MPRSSFRLAALPLSVPAALTALAVGASPAAGQAREFDEEDEVGRAGRAVCGTAIPADEARRYVPLPRGDVFCPLIADPKELGSFLTYLRGTRVPFDTDIGSVGIGDRFGLLRWGGPGLEDGVQISLVGSVFAQFDLRSESYDLINADYLVALPLTVRRGDLSMRLRLYHQSSHLGDEFLLRSDRPDRENVSFESVDLLLSQDAGPLRYYAGGEFFFRRHPQSLERSLAHVGAELRQTGGTIGLGRIGNLRLVAATDVKASQEQDWKPGWSVRAGFEVGRPADDRGTGRHWRVLYEWYRGPSPYGQFFVERLSYYGVGMHFTL